MQVEWIIPWPVSAAVSPRRSDADDLRNRLQQFIAQHWGYAEVSKADSAYPALTLSVNGDLAVVHHFPDADACFLLQGDGQIPAGQSHDFQVQDDLVAFTGDFISSSARAADLIDAFARGVDPDQLGTWSQR